MTPNSYRKLYRTLAAEQHALLEDVGDEINVLKRSDMTRLAAEYTAMQSDQLLEEGDPAQRQSILNAIRNDDFDTSPQSFFTSLTSGNRNSQFLSVYSPSDFEKMKTFVVRGHNVGFALKGGSDIVSVHNNTGVGGLGKELIEAAKRHGGDHLDHFDGFLTEFYRSLGFSRIVNVDEWNDAYAPANWKADPIDIDDERRSVYAEEWSKIKRGTPEWKAKTAQYAAGKPDVVYRFL